MTNCLLRTIGKLATRATLVAGLMAVGADAAEAASGYVIVVRRTTSAQKDWAEVVSALEHKYDGQVIVCDEAWKEALPELQRLHPRYTCFVAQHPEVTRQMVAEIHDVVRRYDEDSYADTFWGILTGYDAACALRIAKHDDPLVVRKVASGTEVALAMCEQGLWYDELVQSKMVRKLPDGQAEQQPGPADTTAALVATLNEYHADLLVTSGHATERDWQIGFRYRNGSFRSRAGQLFGVDTEGEQHPIDSSNPKVYLPIGNCLMGHIDGPDAMALAWMNDAGVHQMMGYTVPTWYGYMGWGCLDYFVEQPGRFTLAEAYLANHHALIHRLQQYFPDLLRQSTSAGRVVRPAEVSEAAKAAGLTTSDGAGLLFDRDVVAFYGDPKWSAKMADGPRAWEQQLREDDGIYTFTITPQQGPESFQPINTNGSQRGWRPIVQFFESRLTEIELLAGDEFSPIITDDFLLIPNPQICDPSRAYVVKFRAKILVE